MSTLQQALDRMVTQAAGIGRDESASPLVDSDVTAAICWPNAIRSVVYDAINRGDDLQDLMQSHSITITNGVGTLPSTLLRESIDRAIFDGRLQVESISFKDYQYYSLPRNVFPRGKDFFSLLGSSIYFVDKDTPATDTYSGTLTVYAPTLDANPSDPDAEMNIPERMVDSAIMVGASVLRGDIKLADLLKAYTKAFRQPTSFEMDDWRS